MRVSKALPLMYYTIYLRNILLKNSRCERCKSMEFPRVVEIHPINSKKLLKMVLKDYSDNLKQSVSISTLEEKYKNHFTNNDQRLIVLCRSCNDKEEARKIERYHHEVPPIMRKGATRTTVLMS